MDPGTGQLYFSIDAAKLAGILSPVELIGRPEDVERVSAAVASAWAAEQRAKRNSKNKAARAARRANR